MSDKTYTAAIDLRFELGFANGTPKAYTRQQYKSMGDLVRDLCSRLPLTHVLYGGFGLDVDGIEFAKGEESEAAEEALAAKLAEAMDGEKDPAYVAKFRAAWGI